MKADVILINTARGAIINTQALITFLEAGKIGRIGIDALEDKAQYFSIRARNPSPAAQTPQKKKKKKKKKKIAKFTDANPRY